MPEQGWGFTQKGQTAENTNVSATLFELDELCSDRVDHPQVFRMDVPPGEYNVYILSGACRQLNRAESEVRDRWIKVDGTTVAEEKRDFDTFYAPDGIYFRSYQTFHRPDQSLWSRYMAHHFPVYRFTCRVSSGLEMHFSQQFSLNAMLVYPASDPNGRKYETTLDSERREWFDTYYTEALPQDKQPSLEASSTQKEGGLVLFSRHFMKPVQPRTVPGQDEIDAPVKLFGAQGERVTGQIGFLSLKDVGAVEIGVSDLNGPGRIPQDRIRIEYCRYIEALDADKRHYEVRPAFLTRQHTVPGDAHTARAFFVTVHVPDTAPAGVYSGTIIFKAPGGITKTLPLRLRVVGFRLPKSDRKFGMYYTAPDNTVFRAYSFLEQTPEDILHNVTDRQHDLMQELGFNTVSAALSWGAIGIDEETGEARIVDEKAWKNWLYHFDLMRDRGFEAASLFGMGWTLFLNRCPHFLRRSSIDGMQVDDIRFSEEAKEPAAKMIRLFYTAARERNWPEIYFYMADELGNHGRRGSQYGQELAKFLQEIKPMVGHPYKVFYSTLSAEIAEPMLPDLDIVCPNSAFPLNGKALDLVRSKGPDLWIYNAGMSRLSYGYYLWLVDAKGRLQWSMNYVMSVPDAYFGFANVGHINTVLDPDWNCIPTQSLYSFREGIDDLRYLQLLQARLQANPDHSAAKEANAVIEELRSRLSRDFIDAVNSWQPSTYDYFRWKIAEAIAAFEK